MKTKIKSYGNNINTNFQGKKVPPKNILYKCLSLIMLDSVIRANKKLSLNTFGRMSKRNIKDKMGNLINDDLNPSSSDSESDNESDN